MKQAKYIVLKDTQQMIVFPPFVQHETMAKGLIDFRMPLKEQVLSAGFCQIWSEDGKVKYACYGESISLGLEADEERDSELLKRLFEDPS
jgi:hypothetical protein